VARRQARDFAAGEATGRAVGARVLTFAQSDLVGLTNPLDPPIGPPPVGPGNWIYAPPPLLARGNLSARSFFLTSPGSLRVAPHRMCGSPLHDPRGRQKEGTRAEVAAGE